MKVLLHHPRLALRWEDVVKVGAEGAHGSFVILPRHIDVVAPLVPGLLHVETAEKSHWLALHEGVLVKQGDTVSVASVGVVEGESLDVLASEVHRMSVVASESEKKARAALAGLEANLVRGLIALERHA